MEPELVGRHRCILAKARCVSEKQELLEERRKGKVLRSRLSAK